ncbi:MAG: RsmE family RNA methyltransferase [Myxococcota bacterium]
MGEARRLFAASLPVGGGEVHLGQDAARHARVLRLAPGDPVVLFDGEGREAHGRIVSLDEEAMRCEVEAPREVASEGPRVVLLLATPKAGKLDTIVRMATEAGAAAIHMVHTERAVGRLDARRAATRMERLGRVAREAARQAGRANVPELRAPEPLADVLTRVPPASLRLLADAAARGGVGDAATVGGDEAWVVVGPEGGLTDRERARLVEAGFVPVRLGPHVLRVETAAPVAVAMALDRLRGHARAR